MAHQNGVYFEKIMTAIIIIFLVVISFFLLKPILLAIIAGLLLAFIFTPLYKWFYKKTKSKNLSASIVMVLLALIIIIPLWFLTPILITQSLKFIQATLQIDFVNLLKEVFPGLFRSEQISAQISSALTSFATKIADSITGSLSYILLNFPTISLQLLVVLFTFFFVLRDQEDVADYVKSLLPFPKEIENKLFTYSTDITKSVLFGQVIIGIVQGLIAGLETDAGLQGQAGLPQRQSRDDVVDVLQIDQTVGRPYFLRNLVRRQDFEEPRVGLIDVEPQGQGILLKLVLHLFPQGCPS